MLNLLISYTPYMIIGTVLVLCMLVSSIAAIVLVLMQPSNSDGIQAIQGSSETFFGKNKGKSIEEKMKKWTYIALGVLALFSILFFVLGALFTL